MNWEKNNDAQRPRDQRNKYNENSGQKLPLKPNQCHQKKFGKNSNKRNISQILDDEIDKITITIDFI